MNIRELLQEGIAPTASAIRGFQVSCREVASALLEAARATEPVHHAYEVLLSDAVLAEADARDAELRAGGPRGPLHGIPISYKDSICTAAAPTTGGSRALAGWIPGRDAAVVARAVAAGAVTIGKTVMHEFGFGQNRIPTRSALDPRLFPGGSSAGSAASVALGSAGASVGTDAGGSSRIPAAYNGIVGLKPTAGRISRAGVIRCSPALDHMGLLTRTVADSRLLLSVLAGHDPEDPATVWQLGGGSADEADSDAGAPLRVGIVPALGESVDSDVARVAAETIATLERRGVEFVELDPLPLEEMAVVTGIILQFEGSASHARLLRARGADYAPETRWVIQAGMLVPGARYDWALTERVRLQQRVRAAYEAAGVVAVLCPTVPQHAIDNTSAETVTDPAHPDSLDRMVRNTTFANLLGMPALSVPAGRADDGIPVSMQLVGRPRSEARLFRLGAMIESKDPTTC